MDQQFQQYEQYIKNLFQKVKGAVLPIADAKIKWQIVALCVFILIQKGIHLYRFASDYLSYFSYDDGSFLAYTLLLSVFPLISFVGALLMLFGNRVGWFILFVFLIRSAGISAIIFFYTQFWTSTIDSQIIWQFDDLLGLGALRILVSFLLYLGMSVFMYKESFRKVYKVERKSLLIPMVIAVAIVATEYFLGMI